MKRCAGFTLLEVIVAVLMIGMIALTLYRFVSTTILGIQTSTEHELQAEKMSALFRYIDAQLDELQPFGQSTLLGTPHKFGNNLNADELQWRGQAGSGTMTGAAEGEWFTILTLMPEKGSRQTNLVLRRRNVNAADNDYEREVPLVPNVSGLKFEFYSAQLQAWLDRWNDQNARPKLVRMLLWRTKDSPPERAVFTVNSARVER